MEAILLPEEEKSKTSVEKKEEKLSIALERAKMIVRAKSAGPEPATPEPKDKET